MRWFEFAEVTDPALKMRQQAKKRQRDQARKRNANEQLSAGRDATVDALRLCQKRQQKAREDNDPVAAAEASRKFQKARERAQSQISSAQANLRK
jgi:hypothetical protein